MPLTRAESDFLAGYTFEYMRVELGPAIRKLKEWGGVYTDLCYLLEAYIWENGLQLSKVLDQHGNFMETEGFGRYDPIPPDPPWPDQETAQRRNAEMLEEREKLRAERQRQERSS